MYIKSPLNYTGGKYKLLDGILACLPKSPKKFVDLFAGGFNVGVNVSADTILANDHISYLIELYKFFQTTSISEIIDQINQIIAKYSLDQYNVEGYNLLRSDYNKEKSPIFLFVLTCYAFNHQIRFNNSLKFNTPFGKERSSYNKSIEENLVRFSEALKKKNIVFSNIDFRNFDFKYLNAGDVVYCDPPYLISTSTYNDGKRGFGDWTEQEDADLRLLLDELNGRGIIFALSNVFYHKGESNDNLIEWAKKYHVNYFDKKYSNCSYQFKDRKTKTVEVLVTNYIPEFEIG